MKKITILSLILLIIATGCSDLAGEDTHGTENPTAEEILSLDKEADIFQFKGVVFATKIDWVEDKTLTKDELVGEIKVQNEEDTNFEDDMSNKLPVGAKIYTTKEENDLFLLVDVDGELFKYYGLVEG